MPIPAYVFVLMGFKIMDVVVGVFWTETVESWMPLLCRETESGYFVSRKTFKNEEMVEVRERRLGRWMASKHVKRRRLSSHFIMVSPHDFCITDKEE